MKVAGIEAIVLSISELDACQEAKRKALRSEFVFFDRDNRYLTKEEVQEMEADQLLIGPDEIFARHGVYFPGTGDQCTFSRYFTVYF